jgi:uncharacterized protein YbbC (DUF1343 family)
LEKCRLIKIWLQLKSGFNYFYIKSIIMKKKLVIILCFSLFTIPGMGQNEKIITGAERTELYMPLIKGKNIAIVANQTSMVGKEHLVDTLVAMNIKVSKIFSPEHGFREMAEAGKKIQDGIDEPTGIHVVSLYGSQRKPVPADMEGLDYVLLDLQDVGARFYTYLSTMHYVMEACAENNVPLIILDRPNPNGFYVDGPMPEPGKRSFVCMEQVPVVHGMTLGEMAMMINDKKWLDGGIKCNLQVIKCRNYSHIDHYILPIAPSPNLPDMNSVYLYPSLCLSEGTVLSCGRGTSFPFQVIGNPLLPDKGFSFTPMSTKAASEPPCKGEVCYGTDMRNALETGIVPGNSINLEWLVESYKEYPDKENFFNSFFDTLAGGSTLRKQIIAGMTAKQIRKTWQDDLKQFMKVRQKYLLYL